MREGTLSSTVISALRYKRSRAARKDLDDNFGQVQLNFKTCLPQFPIVEVCEFSSLVFTPSTITF